MTWWRGMSPGLHEPGDTRLPIHDVVERVLPGGSPWRSPWRCLEGVFELTSDKFRVLVCFFFFFFDRLQLVEAVSMSQHAAPLQPSTVMTRRSRGGLLSRTQRPSTRRPVTQGWGEGGPPRPSVVAPIAWSEARPSCSVGARRPAAGSWVGPSVIHPVGSPTDQEGPWSQ